jgi:hypothetical protein
LISPIRKGVFMPKELKSKDDFQKLLNSATEVRIKRNGDEAKIKLRTEDALYTFKTTGAEADSLTKGLKTPVVEF